MLACLTRLSVCILLLVPAAARAADKAPAKEQPAAKNDQGETAKAPVVPPRQGKRETLRLFNGKDLTGWKGHSKYWSVKDGVIVGRNTEPVPVSTYLLTDRSFSDFRIVFDFRLAEAEMHSGLAMWGRVAPERGDPYTYAGLLVMFPSGYGFYDLYGRAGILKNGDIARPVGHQHDWNHIEILAQGNRVRFVLNGKLISDWREPEPDRIHEAPLGLQLHSNKVPQEVQFKNLELETFPEDRLKTVASGANARSDAAVPAKAPGAPEKLRVYIGTYTRGGKSEGIYRSDLSLADGKLTSPELAGKVSNPSFLAIDPTRRYIAAVSELSDKEGKKSGGVSSFAIDHRTGNLSLLSEQLVSGSGPCHVSIDPTGRNVVVACYSGGSVSAFPLRPDGKLGRESCSIDQHGQSIDGSRQREPHAHSINFDQSGRFALSADLGTDQVLVYRLDAYHSMLSPDVPAGVCLEPGSGPRHLAFHPSGEFAYVINELSSTVTALAYNFFTGALTPLGTVSTLSAPHPKNYPAEVQVHPSGKFVYGSNRGHDSIAVFKIDPHTGTLALVGHQTKGIKTPRNFGIDPTGRYLLVANQDSNDLVLFRIDQETGMLEPTGQRIEVPKPVCVKMLPVAG